MAFLELIKSVGASIGNYVKPVGGVDDSGNAQFLQLDSSGNLKTTASFSNDFLSIVGYPKYSLEHLLWHTKFSELLNSRKFTLDAVGSTVNYSLGNGFLSLDSGLSSGYIIGRSRQRIFHSAFSGYFLTFGVVFSDLGEVGNEREFGFGDGSDGFFFRLKDASFDFVYRKGGGDVLVVPSSSWDKPFTLDTNFHFFSLQYSLSSRLLRLFIDGSLCHTILLSGSSDLFFAHLEQYVWLRNRNLNATSSTHSLKVSQIVLFSEVPVLDSEEIKLYEKYWGTLSGFLSFGSSPTGLIALENMRSINGVENKRKTIVKFISLSSSQKGQVIVYKNADIIGGTVLNPEEIRTPRAPSIQLDSSVATGSGYNDNDNVSYRITVLGSSGESLGSVSSSSINVGSPKQRVVVSLPIIEFGVAYALYRDLNGANNYSRIAIIPKDVDVFIDDAYDASSFSLPGVGTAVSDNFCRVYEGFSLDGGQRVGLIYFKEDTVYSAIDGMKLFPGENLALELDLNNSGKAVGSVVWFEESV